jgi:hypothetical protein
MATKPRAKAAPRAARRDLPPGEIQCLDCRHFSPALDPQVRRAFAGSCWYKEWPFTLNIPLGGPPEWCEDYEATGIKKVVEVAAAAGVAAEEAAAVARVDFYYHGGMAPGAQYPCDPARAAALVARLAGKGMAATSVDLAHFAGELFPIYNAAVTGPSAAKRAVFGMKGALEEDFGRTVPALLLFRRADDARPVEVYPRMDRELNRVIGVEEALEKLLKA